MPGFGSRPAEKGLFWIKGGDSGEELGGDRPATAGMLTPEMIEAIVELRAEPCDGAPSSASIAWFPEIRNILSLLVGIGVLCGSVYLLLATNIGARLGLLIAIAALFGWMTTMGAIWWIYGIGMQGEAAHWQVVEINTGDLDGRRASKPPARLPEPSRAPRSVGGPGGPPRARGEGDPARARRARSRRSASSSRPTRASSRSSVSRRRSAAGGSSLPSDPIRGDAVATADAALGPDGEQMFELDGRLQGPRRVRHRRQGPPRRRLDRSGASKHKLAVDLALAPPDALRRRAGRRRSSTSRTDAGRGTPPPPQADPDKPVISVIMVRDLGDLRFPAADRDDHVRAPLRASRAGGSTAARSWSMAAQSCEPGRGGADGCQYLPRDHAARARRRVRRRSARSASKLLAPQRPTAAKVGALRVRHRPRARTRPSASRCASTSWR